MKASRRVKMEVVAVVLAIIAVLAVVFIAGQVYKTTAPAEKPAVSAKSEFAAVSYTQEISPNKISFIEKQTSSPLAEVIFSGLKTDIKNVDSKIVASSKPMFRSGIFAVRDGSAVFSEARITMKKTGNVNVIFYCSDFDFEKESCLGEWAKSDIPFTQTREDITFTVNHFSAYAPGEFGIFSEFQGSGVCDAYANNDSILTGDISDCLGTSITINASNVVFDCQGYYILNSSVGFQAENLTNITIENCNVNALGNGLTLSNISNSSILNNSVSNAGGSCIGLSSGYGNFISGNRVSSSHGSAGFAIDTSSNNYFENNQFFGNSGNGLNLNGQGNNSFVNNSFFGNSQGFSLAGSNGNLFENNSFFNNSAAGFYLTSGENNSFAGNNFSGNIQDGFQAYNSGHNSFANNRAFNNQNMGFRISSSTGSTLENDSAFNNSVGFSIVGASHDTMVFNSTAFGNGLGFETSYTVNSTIAGISAYSNSNGFNISPYDINITVENSTIAGNSVQDLLLAGSYPPYNRSLRNVLLGPNTIIGENVIANISPLVIYSSQSSIDYGNLLLSNVSLNGSASVELNSIYLDSSKIPSLNISANITFRNLRWTSMPQLFKDGIRCDDNPALCNITGYDTWTGILTAQVSSFSNFTTGNASTCFNVTDDLYINGNAWICPGTYYVNDTSNDGIIIVNASGSDPANPLTLDVSSVTLIGNGSGKGIVAVNKSYVWFRVMGSAPVIKNFSNAIYLENYNGSSPFNIQAYITGNHDGLFLYNSTNTI